jgi:2,3-bisphosphoglycerate-dependent phosphoglycerate mutase
MVLVILRHGQSQWNLENRFAGFSDPELTAQGVTEAHQAGILLRSKGIVFDAVFTSTLQRAIQTAKHALTAAGQDHLIGQMIAHPDLRERDYGDLTGLNKDETITKYGAEQVHIWRRSYDITPPGGESLQDLVEKRTGPYFHAHIKPLITQGKNVLVAAHGNSLRALLIAAGKVAPEAIDTYELHTGVPVLLDFDDINTKS